TGLSRRGSRVRVPSAAPYSVTWNTERQVTTENPPRRVFFCLELYMRDVSFHRFSDLFEKNFN
ncbi:hypothetical protein, partial [Pseudomonas sp. B707]|uniref:hypothetical protein n=1 Tax=Pseudomonas sp. B707 TaxID=2689570 RepID=UPI001F109266